MQILSSKTGSYTLLHYAKLLVSMIFQRQEGLCRKIIGSEADWFINSSLKQFRHLHPFTTPSLSLPPDSFLKWDTFMVPLLAPTMTEATRWTAASCWLTIVLNGT